MVAGQLTLPGIFAAKAVALVAAMLAPAVALAAVPPSGPGKDTATWTMTNTPERARSVTPSGVVMTVDKQLAPGVSVSKAEAVPANPSAPPDEYLIPVNAKAAPAISDLYEGFRARPNSWSDIARLTFTFSSPVRNPRLHIAGTGGASGTSGGAREDYWSGLALVGGSPGGLGFTNAAGFPGFEVNKYSIMPERIGPEQETTCGVVYMCGTALIEGVVTSFTVELRARTVRRATAAGDPFLWGVFRVTFDEDSSDAPASYGTASHSISDLAIGEAVTADHPDTVSSATRRIARDDDDVPAWLPADRAVKVQAGKPVRLEVPVRTARAAALSGWIDFNRDGLFQQGERATAAVPAGASSVALTWTAPRGTKLGASWLRLRAATDTVSSATGWSSTGEVEDEAIVLTSAA